MIKQLVDRGVDVTIFIRPDTDRNMGREWAQNQLPALYCSGATVIRSQHEHRKVIVIDESVVLFGSLNPLSSSMRNSTRENMLTLEGREFARRIIEYLHARDHGMPKVCPRCNEQCEIHRSSGRSSTWFWYCRNCKTRRFENATVHRPAIQRE